MRIKGGLPPSTTIGLVVTNAALTKPQVHRLAVMADDGLARAIRPAHAPMDGDTVSAVATGTLPISEPDRQLTEIGHCAADCLARAIARGVSLKGILAMIASFREKDTDTPVVLMGYLNPIERYGHAEFAADAAKAGVDGILMVDCPPEEMVHLRGELDTHGIYPICLVAPTTTPERMERIARQARGYIYYVSFKGITGADRLEQASLAEPVAEIRSHTGLPLAVGFGIKGPESAAAVSGVADGVVIGSALVERLAGAGSESEACRRVSDFLAPIRAAMDNSRI